jgi:hypothetical protein
MATWHKTQDEGDARKWVSLHWEQAEPDEHVLQLVTPLVQSKQAVGDLRK